MPRLKENQVPAYRLHQQSGQGIVTLNGRDYLLGKHDSTESGAKYRLTAEWQATRGRPPGRGRFKFEPVQESEDPPVSVAELLAGYLRLAKTYYRKNGEPTSKYGVYLFVSRPLCQLYGPLAATNFSPLKLHAVINEMVRLGWERKSINNHIHRVRRIFDWGVANELLPIAVADSLKRSSH